MASRRLLTPNFLGGSPLTTRDGAGKAGRSGRLTPEPSPFKVTLADARVEGDCVRGYLWEGFGFRNKSRRIAPGRCRPCHENRIKPRPTVCYARMVLWMTLSQSGLTALRDLCVPS
jgi:hypothetical protein